MKINGKEIIINRRNVAISEIDEAYCALCRKILDKGVETENRTGVNTKAIAGWTHTFNIGKAFPIPETKLVVASNLAKEIQWIHQVQSNKVKWLRDRDNDIWNEWCIDSDGIWREYVPLKEGEEGNPYKSVLLTKQVLNHKDILINGDIKRLYKRDGFGKQIEVRPDKESLKRYIEKHGVVPTIRRATYFGEKYADTIGEQYGFINALYQQPQIVEYLLKNNQNDRRMQINLWQRAHFAKAVLPSCVFDIMFTVIGDTLHASVIQRSADVPAGLPFNIAQYALLVEMYAKAAGLKVGTLTWNIMNAHIYVDQINAIKKQLKRYDYMKEYEKTILTSTDETIEREYNIIAEKYNLLNEKAFQFFRCIPQNKIAKQVKNYKIIPGGITKEAFDKIPLARRYKLLREYSENLKGLIEDGFVEKYEEAFERKECFEHMLTRETPYIELENHNSIFDYSTDYVKKGDSYLKENPIGNKELVLKCYHPTSFISVPVAQ